MRLGMLATATFAVTAGFANAQTRTATIVNGGNANGGKCTVDVIVDGSAQVEVKGDRATLKNTGGQSPQWRRFECTGPLPGNPANFRFTGVDGRGRQTLIRDPRSNGGAALIQIEDSDAGSEGYTFDLFWGNEPAGSGGFRSDREGGPPDRRDQNDRGFRPPDDRPYDRSGFRRDRRMTEDEAFDVCRRSIRDQAADRFRTPNIDIRSVKLDDNPGRRDWVTGDVAVRRRFGRQNIYGFSCSVNFDTGEVRSAHIDQFERGYYPERRY